MKILHLYPQDEQLIARHVEMLGDNRYSNSELAASPDIVHVHGCWRYGIVKEALNYHRQGVRIVFSPHGGLEPWIIKERQFSEKLAKTLLWQRRLAESSYVMIVHGAMERDALQQLKWNPRIETIRNAVVTNSITPEAMNQHTREVYRKVMDSNTIEVMAPETLHMLPRLLKAGITGDRRWLEGEEVKNLSESEWRKLLLYADHENVRSTVDRGLSVMRIQVPLINTTNAGSYLPTNYKLPQVGSHDVIGITGEMQRGPLTLRQMVEMDRALRRDSVDDEQLTDALTEKRLCKFFRRILQILTEVTLLDEGFLPAAPIDDRQTKQLRNLLKRHLRI